MSSHDLKPMSVGQIVDLAFWTCRRQLATFLAAGVLFVLPGTLLGGAVDTLTQRAVIGPTAGSYAQGVGAAMLGSVLSVLIHAMAWSLAGGVIARIVSARCLGREALSVGEVLGRLGSVLPRLVLLGLLLALLLMVGALALVVPAVLGAIGYALAVPLVSLEHAPLGKAFSRSIHLVRGNGMRVLLLLLVLAGVGLILHASFSGAGLLIGRYVLPQVPLVQTVAEHAARVVVSMVLAPLTFVALTLLYFDLRVRKEGLDLRLLIEEYGSGHSQEQPAHA